MSDIYNELPGMLFDNIFLMKQFNKDRYKPAFEEYCEKYKQLFDDINSEYNEASDKEGYIKKIADAFVGRAREVSDSLKKRADKENFIVDHNSVLTVYVLPSMVNYGTKALKDLADEMAARWNDAFDRYKICVGTFEEIDGGFKRKLCYITTAVCENLGKPDDCYELRILRNYRDNYLLGSESGRGIVDTYYNIAPTIVNRINKKSDRDRIYRSIFEEYISPCISFIESDEPEKCKELYSDMVYSLRDEYMYGLYDETEQENDRHGR